MKIIACCKAAPEEQDIVVRDDGSLDFSRADYKFGSYDLNAIEAARVLADQVGGEVIGLSVGSSELANSKLRKDALSRGLDELVVVTRSSVGEDANDSVSDLSMSDLSVSNLDSYQTAKLLADALEQMGDYDLVLCGAGSSDFYAQQVGNQLGALLGITSLSAINSIKPDVESDAEISEAATNIDSVIVQRLLEQEVQCVRVKLPAVLSVTSGINVPRIAGMKDILAAGKKPVKELVALGTPETSTQTISVKAPPAASRKQEIIQGDANESVARLLELASSVLR
ncbi:MAG: hypothetical protein LBG97_03070 [Coriobacteriales bacterium]|jgi:electron transfer flavoprotein beta subunit|nr:hypothetical protein [Coriobacteriales bacterium]